MMKLSDGKKELELINCKSFYKRLKGFMFEKNINKALLFDRCNSIHTFFMKEDIDVIMIDKENNIVYFKENLKKNRILIKKKAYHTIELPHNSIKNININDKLTIS